MKTRLCSLLQIAAWCSPSRWLARYDGHGQAAGTPASGVVLPVNHCGSRRQRPPVAVPAGCPCAQLLQAQQVNHCRSPPQAQQGIPEQCTDLNCPNCQVCTHYFQPGGSQVYCCGPAPPGSECVIW